MYSTISTMFTLQHYFSVIPHETAVHRYAAIAERPIANCSCVGLQCVILNFKFYAWKFALGALVLFVNAKLKKQSQKKLISRPPFKFLVAKPKKIAKKINFGGVSFAKIPVSQILKVCTVEARNTGLGDKWDAPKVPNPPAFRPAHENWDKSTTSRTPP